MKDVRSVTILLLASNRSGAVIEIGMAHEIVKTTQTSEAFGRAGWIELMEVQKVERASCLDSTSACLLKGFTCMRFDFVQIDLKCWLRTMYLTLIFRFLRSDNV